MSTSQAQIENQIVRLLAQRAAASSICPSEVARALAPGDEAAWRALMPRVREAAQSMSDAGRVRITRGGVAVACADLHRGAVRLSRGTRFDS